MPDWSSMTGAAGVFKRNDVALVYRASLISSLGAAIAAISLLSLAGQPFAGIGVCIGLAGGAASNRLFQASTSKIASSPGGRVSRQLGSRAVARLGTITVVVLLLLVFAPPFGAGVLAGLALFQFLLLAHMARLLLRQRKAGR
jgi:hypothetical protein